MQSLFYENIFIIELNVKFIHFNLIYEYLEHANYLSSNILPDEAVFY